MSHGTTLSPDQLLQNSLHHHLHSLAFILTPSVAMAPVETEYYDIVRFISVKYWSTRTYTYLRLVGGVDWRQWHRTQESIPQGGNEGTYLTNYIAWVPVWHGRCSIILTRTHHPMLKRSSKRSGVLAMRYTVSNNLTTFLFSKAYQVLSDSVRF